MSSWLREASVYPPVSNVQRIDQHGTSAGGHILYGGDEVGNTDYLYSHLNQLDRVMTI